MRRPLEARVVIRLPAVQPRTQVRGRQPGLSWQNTRRKIACLFNHPQGDSIPLQGQWVSARNLRRTMMELQLAHLVLASIVWIAILAIAVVAILYAVNSRFDAVADAVLTVNDQFSALDRKFEATDRKIDALDNKFDRKIDNLQNVILQHTIHRPGRQDRE